MPLFLSLNTAKKPSQHPYNKLVMALNIREKKDKQLDPWDLKSSSKVPAFTFCLMDQRPNDYCRTWQSGNSSEPQKQSPRKILLSPAQQPGTRHPCKSGNFPTIITPFQLNTKVKTVDPHPILAGKG